MSPHMPAWVRARLGSGGPLRPWGVVLAVGGIGALALALRWHAPYAQLLYPDAAYYMRRAAAFLGGEWSIAPPWGQVPGGGPVYPLLTSLLAPFAGGVERAGTDVSRLAGVALAMGVVWAGIRLGGVLAGLLAGALVAFAPPLVHLSEVRLSDALFLALWVGALLWGGRIVSRRHGRLEPLGLGMLLGAVVLTRAVGVTAVPAVVAILLWAGFAGPPRRRGSLWRAALWVVLGTLLVVVPYQSYAWSHGWRTSLDYPLPDILTVASDDGPDAATSMAPDSGGATDAGPVDELGGVAVSLAGEFQALARLLPLPILVLAVLGLVFSGPLGRRLPSARSRLGVDLLLVGGGLCYLLALALFGSRLTRYLVVLYPVVFLYAGLGLAALADGAVRLLRWERGSAAATALAALLCVAAVGGGVAGLRADATAWTWDEFPPFDRTMAGMTAAATKVAEPVYVHADTGALAYYLHGFWLGPALPPAGPRALPAGTRIVLLNTDHLARWPERWRAAFAAGKGVLGFRPVAQRYWSDHHRLLTVYVRGAANPPVPPASEAPRLGPEANLVRARAAFRAAPKSRAAQRALGAIELLMGQYVPERIAVARAHYRRAASLPASAAPPEAAGARVWWARPPGEIYLARDDLATHWNRAAAALAMGDPRAAWTHVRALNDATNDGMNGDLGDDPRLAYLTGMILVAAGQAEPALPALAAAGRALPDDPAVQVNWGNTLGTAGRFGAAERVYRRVLDRDPDNFGVWLNLYQVLAQARKWDAADAVRQHMAALRPTPQERDRMDRLVRQVERMRGLG